MALPAGALVAAPESANTALELRRFLKEHAGSPLKAWIKHFDPNNTQRISKYEFSRAMRVLGYAAHPHTLFASLDMENVGVLSLDDIDPAQASIWKRFRRWCVDNFKSSEAFLRCIKGEDAEVPVLDSINFCQGLRRHGWKGGFESLIFSAIDVAGDGAVTQNSLCWLTIEIERLNIKLAAKAKVTQFKVSNGKREAEKLALGKEFEAFKELLQKRHMSIVRAWRLEICRNNSMKVARTNFLKACAQIGYGKYAKQFWKLLDEDNSGFASIDDFDEQSAKILVHFKKFVSATFGKSSDFFKAANRESTKKMSFEDFHVLLEKFGFQTQNAKMLFKHLDRNGFGQLDEEDMLLLERWKPLETLLAEPNEQAMKDVKNAFLRRYGQFLKAWRLALDQDGSNRCTWKEFKNACKQISFSGDIAGAWRMLDKDQSGFITLSEIDASTGDVLLSFRQWASKEFGSVSSAFEVIDADGSNSITFQEFRSSLQVFGFDRPAKPLFQGLLVRDDGTLRIQDVAFLDEWEVTEEEIVSQAQIVERRKSLRMLMGIHTLPNIVAAVQAAREQIEEPDSPSELRSSTMHGTTSAKIVDENKESCHETVSTQKLKWASKVDDPMQLLKVVRQQKTNGVNHLEVSTLQKVPRLRLPSCIASTRGPFTDRPDTSKRKVWSTQSRYLNKKSEIRKGISDSDWLVRLPRSRDLADDDAANAATGERFEHAGMLARTCMPTLDDLLQKNRRKDYNSSPSSSNLKPVCSFMPLPQLKLNTACTC